MGRHCMYSCPRCGAPARIISRNNNRAGTTLSIRCTACSHKFRSFNGVVTERRDDKTKGGGKVAGPITIPQYRWECSWLD